MTALEFLKLGDAHYRDGKWIAAIEAYRRARELAPDHPGVHNALGCALHRAEMRAEAIPAFAQAIRLRSDFADAYSNLANVLTEIGEAEDAIKLCRQTLKINPDFPGALNNLGNALVEARRPREAIEYFDRVIALNPPFVDRVHLNKATAHLLLGDLQTGFAEYEWRQRRELVTPPNQKETPPLWKGEPLAGRTILITSEQGYGDMVQFIRYAAPLAASGGRVVLACVHELRDLLSTAPGVSLAPPPQDCPHVDVQCPILSLPHFFPATLETLPGKSAYLFADAKRIEKWRPNPGENFRIGLCWASHPTGHDAPRKSCPPHLLSPLDSLAQIEFHGLQLRASNVINPPFSLIDNTDKLKTFADTAALMHHLDLILTIDTAVAHLAGALGKETWLMLPFAADWRWLLDRDDSPWYPTMKLFRQRSRDDWPGVISTVMRALDDRLRL